jgi:hypothetical protein
MKVKIVLRFKFRNHLDQVSDNEVDFPSIHHFRNYLRWEPERAMMIGYGKRDEQRISASRSSDVRLLLIVGDKEIAFASATEFVKYLDTHPEVAASLQYSKA